jgi:hypothetical protein
MLAHPLLKISIAGGSRVPHISLVFCEIWDTTALDCPPRKAKKMTEVEGHILGKTREI